MDERLPFSRQRWDFSTNPSRVYEDMVAGRITEDNFNRILENSQTEQATLKNRVMLNRERLAQQTQEQEDSTRWLEIIKDYADIQELDAVTLNRLVQKIVIHEDADGGVVLIGATLVPLLSGLFV